MSRMTGRALPQNFVEDWQGGLPFAYRIEGGEDLRVRMMVRQEYELVMTANVLARLPGETRPDELVIIGCHHDAWGFGAGDPLSGLIAVFESARCFAEAAEKGLRPARSIIFAAWAAEEYGIIGSTEWCQANRERLSAHAVAYVNLDMASMGTDFSADASPAIQKLIADAAHCVGQARGEEGHSVYYTWTDGGKKPPPFGNLGGGSDHVGFYCHLGIPSCYLGAWNSHGVSYHSNYDTLRWYRQVVGDDYEPALMVTRMTNIVAARLACASMLPMDPLRCAATTRENLKAITERATELDVELDLSSLERAISEYEKVMEPTWELLLETLHDGCLDAAMIERVNSTLRWIQRHWLSDKGPPDRPWYRNLYAATDPHSGYGAWVLPILRDAVERGNAIVIEYAVNLYAAIFSTLEKAEGELARAVQAPLHMDRES